MKSPVTTDEEVNKSAWERSNAANHTMRLLTMQFFGHLHALFGSDSSHILDDNNLLEWNEVRTLYFTALALSVVFAELLHEVALPLHIERPAAGRRRVIDLEEKESAIRPPATSAHFAKNGRIKISFKEYLVQKIPHFFSIVTRALTKYLRKNGVMNRYISSQVLNELYLKERTLARLVPAATVY